MNLNNEIKFKPTELGISIIKNNTYFSPKDNINEVIKTLYHYDGVYMITELWDFMNLFGKYFEHGLNVDELPCDINFEIIKE